MTALDPVTKPLVTPPMEGPFVGAFAESPRTGLAPLWVYYSGISPAARALVAPLLDGALRVHGDQAPTLNREFLAWVLGVTRLDKGVQAALEELVEIGFLTIYDGGLSKNGKRRLKRRDPVTRQALPDIYTVRLDAPDGYQGARNASEAYEQFRVDRDAAYAAFEKSERRNGLVSIHRRKVGRYVKPQVSATPPGEGMSTPPVRGINPFPQVSATPPTGGTYEPSNGGVARSPQVSATPPAGGSLDREKEGERDLSGLSRLTEGATAGPASPSAAPQGPAVAGEVRELVRRLPWGHYGHDLRRNEALQIGVAVQASMARDGLTLEEVREHALRAMAVGASGKARRLTSWVAGAFREDNLLEPLSDDPFAPLDAPVMADRGTSGGDPLAVPIAGGNGVPENPPCEECANWEPATIGKAHLRVVYDPRTAEPVRDANGRTTLCPNCHPSMLTTRS